MRLSAKMSLLFSVIIIISIFALASFSLQNSIDGAAEFTKMRYENMSISISLDLERDIEMMNLTFSTLQENLSFTSAVNQFVRDDTSEQKMGIAARTAALQLLYQSPLVDQYFCVAFFNNNGQYFSSSMDKNGAALNLDKLLELLEANPDGLILAPRQDMFQSRQDVQVYGLVQPLTYQGKQLGYMAILNESSSLSHIMTFVDNSEEVIVEAYFDDGSLFYSNIETPVAFPLDLATDELLKWSDPDSTASYHVSHTYVGSLGIHLFLAQDSGIVAAGNDGLLKTFSKRAVYIIIPALLAIIILSLSLTRSIRSLTKKVEKTAVEGILINDCAALEALNQTVTAHSDKEIHALELSYNHMMLQLRESTLNELNLREGALQAQLSALQTQINPHFIYNTLNIISAKSMECGNLEIIEICDQFASMLRYSTDTRTRTATLQEEIDNVRNYLLLSKARYEENLEYAIDIPDGLHNLTIPKLTLQPLVENALTHGFDGKNMLRKLSIVGTLIDKELILTIRDNGTGFAEDMLSNLRQRIYEIENDIDSDEKLGGHIGLLNTCLRLHYYSKGRIHVKIHNDSGAVITLTMPIE